ncbi:MAG: Hsp20/alpha crystallin family protein [Gammaproteobacteria bacterium]
MLARMNVQPMSLWREFDGMENWLSSANGQAETTSRWVPSVDVIEQQDHYVITADLPGIDRKDIEIVFEEGALTLKGERSDNVESEHDGYKRVERSYGSFQRTFRMPDNINADAITAKSEQGVLEVRVPKQEKAQKKIEVL